MAAVKIKAMSGYAYCTVCRRNHDEGRKHIFVKQHKKRLAEILEKFAKKVDNLCSLKLNKYNNRYGMQDGFYRNQTSLREN